MTQVTDVSSNPACCAVLKTIEVTPADWKVASQPGVAFRDFGSATQALSNSVEETYRLNHMYQTYEFVTAAQASWSRLDKTAMSVWDAFRLLDELVDESDPDISLPQSHHLLQTAEAIRLAYPEEPWFALTGLIHDLGKVMAHPALGNLPQWAVVGDTYPVGCAHSPLIAFPEHFAANPDARDARYRTECGVYTPCCGLADVHMSWGHDEYLYRVLRANGCTLPPEALYVIRYHSFYALHQHGAYAHLLNDEDRRMLPWLQRFQSFDLYSKCDIPMHVAKLKDYYSGLIDRYFPKTVLNW